MITSSRFDRAIRKLYAAFHSNNLHPECAMQCAVGTICDNTDAWKHFSNEHGSTQLNYVGRVHEGLGRKINGYAPSELMKIEAAFLDGCGYQLPLKAGNYRPQLPLDQDVLFQGLCKAIEVLCKLDNLPQLMDVGEQLNYQGCGNIKNQVELQPL
ncbi:MAG: Na(+)-translocating NADH-quinone reductase subunit F [Flavobacterium sp.]|nr:MAG: Na(+)-translocating NADH-quinone reductase subunit F [Flavobacterium sp.]